ncbi:uncharacterized protein LOC135480697 [Liolophura sinensis]|uniref:uncharacterized protein LOC135480697 n=1 Tax=Liolophura sinensis TaxID=3198878 RepID=UPI0031591670
MMIFAVAFVSLFVSATCDFGLINLLYWKADANLDHIISKSELQTIWHGFDKNGDKRVTQAEFAPYWSEITGHSQEIAVAYFLLADLNDDGVIDQSDLDALYKLFDRDGNGQVSAEEFSLTWQKIILDMPFAVMFEAGDINKDDLLTAQEFNSAFFYLDTNRDQQLREGEFSAQWMNRGFGASHQATELFNQMDLNRDHVVSAADLSQLFTRYDSSLDHKISLAEMIHMAGLVPPLSTNRLGRASEIQYEVYLFDAVDTDNNTLLDSAELRALFLIFDQNNDSVILEAEFKSEWVTYLKLGSPEQAATLFKRADLNADGVLTSADLPAIFRYFDQDGDSHVSLNEFLTQWGALQLGPVNTGTVVIG